MGTEAALKVVVPLAEDELLPKNTNRSLPIAMMRARETIMVRFRPLLIARDITEPQWRVMRVLSEQRSLDAGELANRACILAPSLTRIIKALEDRGYVTRVRDRTDGRRMVLSITQEGLAVIQEIAPDAADLYRAVVMKYGAGRMNELIDMLNELAELEVDFQ